MLGAATGEIKMIIGIDVGYRTGGVGLVENGWAEVHDLPIITDNGVDATALLDLIGGEPVDHIYIEAQQSMPKQGVVSVFKLAMAYGQIRATVALSGTPYTLVRPIVWKRALELTRDKSACLERARQLFPKLNDQLKLKKHEHRAEALLIAHYGENK